MKISKKRNGFTLIEMTIVLFIISLLILIIVPNMSNAQNHAKDIHRNAMVSVVQSQVDAYLNDHTMQKNETVNYDELKSGDYLTQAQVDKATKENIEIISNDKVHNHAQVKD